MLDEPAPVEWTLALPPTSLGPVDPCEPSLQAAANRQAHAESCSSIDRFITLPRQSYSLDNGEFMISHIPKSVYWDRKHTELQ